MKPFLIDPYAFPSGGIPVKSIAAPLDSGMSKSLLIPAGGEGAAVDVVETVHKSTGEHLLSLNGSLLPDPRLAALLIGHDRPFFGRVIVFPAKPATPSRQPLIDRVVFLVGDRLRLSSVVSGKRRWRDRLAQDYGDDAQDILDFLNEREGLS